MPAGFGFRSGLSWILALGFGLILPLLAIGEIRVWKSASGTYEIRAEMISADRESVKLTTEDGREISVVLAKLSDADRDYVAAQMDSSSSARDDEKRLKQVVAKFYRAVSRDRADMRSLLTDAGKASYDGSPTFFEDIWGPDKGQHPRVTSVQVNDQDQTAIADYRIRLKGKSWQMQMLFVSEDEQWRVTGIVGPSPQGQGKNTMNFETAQRTTGGDSSPTANQPSPPKTQLAAIDISTQGTAAYAQGLCAKCHGEQGVGTTRGPDLTDDQWIQCDGSVVGIRQILVSGIPKQQLSNPSLRFAMNPATNLVPESELTVLAEYVKALSVGSE
jgi:mono/diheme cytochrome c family protein